MNGVLDLHLGCIGEKTYVIDAYFEAPLKFSKPLYLDGSGGVTLYMLNPSPGIFSGDTNRISLKMEAGCKAILTNQSATKLHRMNGGHAFQGNAFALEEKAILEYFPEPLVPFQGSSFSQETSVSLKHGSTLVLGEVITPGRVHMGEAFEYTRLDLKLSVDHRGRRILTDNILLSPQEVDMEFVMAGNTHYGNFYFISEFAESMYDRLWKVGESLDDVVFGASMLEEYGLTAKMLGKSAFDIQNGLFKLWETVRIPLLGCKPPIPRN